MSVWLNGCGRLYGLVARAFPQEFRAICGDGLERLGGDVIPIVWRGQGLPGLVRLFVDLALHLPWEYVASATGKLKELTMSGDMFEGTWRARIEESQWDPAYTPAQACLRFEATESGYLLVAYGIKDGEAVAERPMSIVADGRRRPLLDLNGRPIPGVPAGALAFGNRPGARILEAGVELDGKVLGGGKYEVSSDGTTLTVTTEGIGVKGPFRTRAVFERVSPDPYLPQA